MREAVVVFIDPEPLAASPDAASSEPADGAAASEASELALLGTYFWIGLVMLAAVALSLTRFGQLVREVWTLRRLKGVLPPVSKATRERVIAPLEERFAVAWRSVDYRVAPPRAMPMTFGGRRPVVVLPRHLLAEGAQSDLCLALTHELVHVRRRDYLARWAERLVDAFFAASPLTRHLLEEIGRYRELACDAEVMQQTEAPGAYASMLARQVFSGQQAAAPAALGMAHSSSFIKTRLKEMERFTRNALPNGAPYGISLFTGMLVLGLVSTGVFLTACSEQPFPTLPTEKNAGQIQISQGVRLDTKVKFEHVSYDSALVDAKENHNGDLLIYFFQEGSRNHQQVLSQALNNERLAQYMNENFARIAIDTATPEGQKILSRFRGDLPSWDFITVHRRTDSDSTGVGMHGWGNIEDQEDVERWLTSLRNVKEGRDILEGLRDSLRK